MSRIARVVMPGCWHHVTQRGNHRQPVFFEDGDRRFYLDLLRRHSARFGVSITGYCLLSNHVHLLVVPARENALAKALGRTHNDYARWLHVRRGDTGHLWQNRFYSCPLEERHQWEALRYVELNPVRAGLVDRAERWPWSSATAHLSGWDDSRLLDLTGWRQRWLPQNWREVLDMGLSDAALLERIREATRTGRPVGTDAFLRQAESQLGRALRPGKRGPRRAAAVGRQLNLGVA